MESAAESYVRLPFIILCTLSLYAYLCSDFSPIIAFQRSQTVSSTMKEVKQESLKARAMAVPNCTNINRSQLHAPFSSAMANAMATIKAKSNVSKSSEGAMEAQPCNMYDGRWVEDDGYPLYKPGSCPFIDPSFRCQENGRPDSLYTTWRWQPYHCHIPRMNGTDLLRRLRNKRLLIVGDSLARNQFESLICILYESLSNRSRYAETNVDGYTAFNFLDFNSTIQYCRSNFLVEDEEERLKLDKIDRYHKNWVNASLIIFNTGHWWTHTKTKTGQNYFEEGERLYPELNVLVAYQKAIKTWARWVDENIDPSQTQVYFRGYSPSHFWGGQWNSGGQCHKETKPIFNHTYITGLYDGYPEKLRIVEDVIQHMKAPVILLNVTRLSDYRKDAHPSIYRSKDARSEEIQDCSHWCLPGLPDIWNELMYASLMI